jgi:hypothetical protein
VIVGAVRKVELAEDAVHVLFRRGLSVVADEAFADCLPGERESLAGPGDLTGIAGIRARLLDRGFAVRRGETFPGPGPGWIRVAVRDTATSHDFAAALADASAQSPRI